MSTSVATLEETFTFNCGGCFQNPFGVHRNACCQMLPRKAAESVSKSVSFLLALLWLISTVAMATLQFLGTSFFWVSGVTEFSA